MSKTNSKLKNNYRIVFCVILYDIAFEYKIEVNLFKCTSEFLKIE